MAASTPPRSASARRRGRESSSPAPRCSGRTTRPPPFVRSRTPPGCGQPYRRWCFARSQWRCDASERPHRRRPPLLPCERPRAARGRGVRRHRRGRRRRLRHRRGAAAAPRPRAPRRAAPRHRRLRRRLAPRQRRGPGDRAGLEPRLLGLRPARGPLGRPRLRPQGRALRGPHPRTAVGPNRLRPMTETIRVVLADDSVLLREGLARLLEDSGFEVAGQSGDAEDLLRKVGAHRPDVAVVDVRMPPSHTDEGLRAAHQIRADHPGVGVLVLSQYVEEAYALDLLSESTERTGYLLKDRVADVDTFTDAVRRVAGGGSALDPEVVALLLGRRRREDPLEALTPREREVLGLMAEGRSNAAIAEALVVTERAVEKHVTSIFTKLDLTPASEDHRRGPPGLRDLATPRGRGAARRCGTCSRAGDAAPGAVRRGVAGWAMFARGPRQAADDLPGPPAGRGS